MKDNRERAEINMARIPVSGDLPGLLFAAGTALIFYWGVPEMRFMLPGAAVAGCGIAVVLHFIHHEVRDELHVYRADKSPAKK
jgi:hypothetical protein